MDMSLRWQVILFLLELLCFMTLLAERQNRCDKIVTITTKTNCKSCILNNQISCPPGYRKLTKESGNKDCRYLLSVNNISLSLPGCSHECAKDFLDPVCCFGYWGQDCMECPGGASVPCSNNGNCSDGISGNGTCTCLPGFGGTACENCADDNLYGPNCTSVCECVHGMCDNGIRGSGLCTCFSGYTGPKCDQEIPECANLKCPMNARCTEEIGSEKLVCKCLPNHEGDSRKCTPINPCLKQVCHPNADCTHTGPNQHRCTCHLGYRGDGQICMPVDPCQDSFGGCPPDSTVCVYDGPGKSHCQCKEGFESRVPGSGCSLTDVCKTNNTCSKNAVCTTTGPGTTDCTCNEGFVGNGITCYGNIMARLQELNTEADGKWTGQLSNAISLFDSSLSWRLTSQGPFTIFVPVNKGFKGVSLKSLLADKLNTRYLAKLHITAGEINTEMLKKLDIYYTLTGKSGEPVNDEDQQLKIRIHGSKKKGSILQGDIVASNGLIHIINKLMEKVEATVESNTKENLLKILEDNGKFNRFRSLLMKSNIADLLEGPGPYTIFAPTNKAFETLTEDVLDYLQSPEGSYKLLELLRNHIVPSVELDVTSIVTSPQTTTIANQVLTFNVTSSGQILVNGEIILEADVEANNGRLYSLDGVLIPSSVVPILPHRCDVQVTTLKMSTCVSCATVTRTSCPSGIPTNSFRRGCSYTMKLLGVSVPATGCAKYCNDTRTIQKCCDGFYGEDCSPCPGGFNNSCSGNGQCIDGISGNGTCICAENFRGSRCQYCSSPVKYGPKCDKPCPCIHGECDNRPDSLGACKEGTCLPEYTGKFCERHIRPCGAQIQFCHAHANCDFNNGAVSCVCKPGYRGDGVICEEIDPCSRTDPAVCGANAKCIKTGPATHTCQCLTGWQKDGDECVEINNCLLPNRGGCHENANCIYIGPAQSDCACKTGYRGNGIDCTPINPCVEQSGECHILASCQFMFPGVWNCVCLEGYEGDGKICYGSAASGLSTLSDATKYFKWVNDAQLYQLFSESSNFTVLVPSMSAIDNMSSDERDFWTTKENLPSIIKAHLLDGVYRMNDLTNLSSLSFLPTKLRNYSVRVTNKIETVVIEDAAISASDIAATNGVIHIIDKVLIPDHKYSEALPDLLTKLGQMPECSIFRGYLIQYSLMKDIEGSDGYTLFVPSNSAIELYLKQKGTTSLEENQIRYHIVLSQKFLEQDLHDGMHEGTMLGFSYQVGFFLQNSQLFVNTAQVNFTNQLVRNGVIHGLMNVLDVQKNRCDKNISSPAEAKCTFCHSLASCPFGTAPVVGKKVHCTFSRYVLGRRFLYFGCKPVCRNTVIIKTCCEGFFGSQCEPCPGSTGKPCFGNGICQDGQNGTGICQCDKGFNGTACETCVDGKYGSHCDQDCSCVHGMCKEGPSGDGSCECDVGWRGVNCDIKITEDSCNNTCHTSANCLTSDGTSYCKCAAGFQGNGTYCTAVDACASNNGSCSSQAVCKRTTPGKRSCLCNAGYTGDGVICLEINPCLQDNGGCHANAECTHTGPNQSACNCLPGYSGDGKSCKSINLCLKKNGGCSESALCTHIGPGERNCTCHSGYVGNGLKCRGSLSAELLSPSTSHFLLKLKGSMVKDLSGEGPFTVFIPTADAFRTSLLVKQWAAKGLLSQVLRYHIVGCMQLDISDLITPINITTLQGEMIQISYSQGFTYLNKDAKILLTEAPCSNGIIHIIDKMLEPEHFQSMPTTSYGSITQDNLTTVAENHGYKKFIKLLQDTDVLTLINNPIHQPVTLFWPTDSAMMALPKEQQDFLFNKDNKAKLEEYLKYHVIRDGKIFAADLPYTKALKTMQGSDLSVSCGAKDGIGVLFLNDQKCRIVQRQLEFTGGIAHGIDCMLVPPSVGGRCDIMSTLELWGDCGYCYNVPKCPGNFKPQITKEQCTYMPSLRKNIKGCRNKCAQVFWRSKCCSNYFGKDCQACPGGPESPCSNHGVCDDGQMGTGECKCQPEYHGTACELCQPGRYGPECRVCNCTEHGSCEEGIMGSGSCFCENGWTGTFCETPLAVTPVCSPLCSTNAVCKENNTCECKPLYEGDGIRCKVVNLCMQMNGGCPSTSKCTQKGLNVTCTCPSGFSGDGYICTSIDPCINDNGGCHEHAICTAIGPNRKKCECKTGYIGDGVECSVRELPINRCSQDHGQCHVNADCTDLHFEDSKAGVFHIRSPKGTYKLTYVDAEQACKQEGAVIATYNQLSYAQEAGFHMCVAGWLSSERVAYPTTYSNRNCGFGHVGIVDYGTRTNLSETWDVFCYRMKDIQCTCKAGYIGNGYSCSGNLLQVLTENPFLSNFLSQILKYSDHSERGKEFVDHLSNLTVHATFFVPDNNALSENETLSEQDIEYHLSTTELLYFGDLSDGKVITSWLGDRLFITVGNHCESSVIETTNAYVNQRCIIEWDISASNGVIHIIEEPLRAPKPQFEFHTGHKAGMGVGVLLLVVLISLVAFISYYYYSRRTKPFQFHYFKSDEGDDIAPIEYINPNICNPIYDAGSPADNGIDIFADKHQVVSSGPYDLSQ
ncbi:stabilin-2 [Erpetoichthys calabaricus]|uniref:stabilin-2 n=1 Tax=Erpetoichthys calabaricus TaxID=27687 RepID=UPI0022341DBB|nr:stabilin-2 [Erpetoichthys calabaricus]